jgi:hypothetical protein
MSMLSEHALDLPPNLVVYCFGNDTAVNVEAVPFLPSYTFTSE